MRKFAHFAEKKISLKEKGRRRHEIGQKGVI
jgi:hypothetical protein